MIGYWAEAMAVGSILLSLYWSLVALMTDGSPSEESIATITFGVAYLGMQIRERWKEAADREKSTSPPP